MQNKDFEKLSPQQLYYQMRCDFYEKFKKEIKPQIRFYEARRKKEYKNLQIIILVLILFGIVALWFQLLEFGFFWFGLAMFWYNFQAKAFEREIKTLIMPLVCSCYSNLNWYNGGIDLGVFKQIFFPKGGCIDSLYQGNAGIIEDSCVVPDYNSSYYDDVFEGVYKNVPFEIIEAKYTKTQGTGKKRSTVTVFDGVIVKLKMNKNFNCHTIIRPDGLFHISPKYGLKHTELEDVNFEKKFDVFTDDEIEARYLITPSFMERLTGLRTAFFAQKISCSFFRDYLFIALFTPKDLFTLGSINRPIVDFSQYEIFHNEIISILKMIDHFKLNENIGL